MAYWLKEPEKTGIFPGNADVTADETLHAVLSFANDESDRAVFYGPWIARIFRYGVKPALIKELNELMEPLHQSAVPVIDSRSHELSWSIRHYDVGRRLERQIKQKKEWKAESKRAIEHFENQKLRGVISQEFADSLIADAHETIQEMANYHADFSESLLAYVLAYFIDDGVFDYLRRCERQECKRYYIGGLKAKWCSDNCGSIVRVKAKRKRDKEAGNLESRYL